MNLNADLIRARCAEIEDSVVRLERFKPLTREEFLADQDRLDIACLSSAGRDRGGSNPLLSRDGETPPQGSRGLRRMLRNASRSRFAFT